VNLPNPVPIVLVVDDDPAITMALQLLFELHGMSAEVARSPADTIDRVSRGGLHLVVHDMNFSNADTTGTDGLALFRALRRLSPRLPVILITSWPQADMSTRVLREGAAAYLAKPWDDEHLIALALGLTRG
jgi:DNA-binding NtrC family response regulator